MNLKKEMAGKIIKGTFNGKKVSEQWINVNDAILIAERYCYEEIKKINELDFFIVQLLLAKHEKKELQRMRWRDDIVCQDLYAPNSYLEEIIKTAKKIIALKNKGKD